MAPRALSTEATADRARNHGTNADLAAFQGSVRPLLLTMATTLMLAMALVILAATSINISALNVGAMLSA